MLKEISFKIQIPKAIHPSRSFSMKLSAQPTKDAPKFQTPKRLVILPVTPDDFNSFRAMLFKAKVIDKYYRWTFGKNHLVLLGAGSPWGDEMVEYLWFIYSLYEKARMAGGALHFLAGVHELSTLNEGWQFEHPLYGLGKSSTATFNAIYGGNMALWNWLKNRNVVELTGQILFAGSAIPIILPYGHQSLQEVNESIRGYFALGGTTMTHQNTVFGHSKLHSRPVEPHFAIDRNAYRNFAAFLEGTGANTLVTYENNLTGCERLEGVQILKMDSDIPGLVIKRKGLYSIGPRGDMVRIGNA